MTDLPNPILANAIKGERRAFVMMSFTGPQSPAIIDSIRKALKTYGVRALRADEHQYADQLWSNTEIYLQACDYAIAVLDEPMSHSVSLEIGYLRALKRPTLILKSGAVSALPPDLAGSTYQAFDVARADETITPAVHDWLRNIGLRKARNEKLVTFVSYGGTCRCAIASVVLREELKRRELPYPIRTMSIALEAGHSNAATPTAREVVKHAYGRDLLMEHRVTRIAQGWVEDADLILTMDPKYNKKIEDRFAAALSVGPGAKLHFFSDFFGSPDLIANPWHDLGKPHALESYRTCLQKIQTIVEEKGFHVVEWLNRSD